MTTTTPVTHTPGPWTVGDEIDSQGRLVYLNIFAGKKRVSSTSVYGHRADGTPAGKAYTDRFGITRHKASITADECRANAKLIAAAPELLEALTWAMDIIDGTDARKQVHAGHGDYDFARAAIAKATS